MLKFRVFVILFHSVANLLPGACVVLPTYLWDTANPLFNESLCGKPNKLQVRVNDMLNFMCPTRAMNSVVMTGIRNYDDMYENIWFTTDEESVRTCNAASAYHLFDCDKPNELMYYGCNFRPRSGKLSFEPGTTYYFFGTGSGKMQGLSNKVGGHCETHNMKLSVYVCHYNEACNRTLSYRCKGDEIIKWRKNTGPTFGKRSGGDVFGSMSKGLFSLFFIFSFCIGLVVGVVLKLAWERIRRKYYHPGPVSSGLVSPAKSSYSDPEANVKLNGNSEIFQNESDSSKVL